ncbi:MAG: class I tRNA ligase family protein, partial [Actinobacteria bacterium]|nr:class I tRNA ligase family protein [Actinomycetota bacterium]
ARSFPGYGELSGNRLDALRPGHRFEGEVDPAKRFHADWALWKKAQDTRTQLVWDTPWGIGFPGWHTECSAMSLALLGDSIDVHTGGIDLRFPHHEDERAQSNSATGTDVVRHWVHGEHLLFEGRKMSKSAGNVVLVSDVVERGLDPLALRLALLQNRYRQQMNLTWDALDAADSTDIVATMVQSLNDDLDTPRVIMMLRELEKSAEISDGAKFETFAYIDRVLGLDLARTVGQAPIQVEPTPPDISELLQLRADARAAKDWAGSDRIRDELASKGFTVTDTPDGQQVQRG